MKEMIGFGELTRPQREQVRKQFHVGEPWDYVYEVSLTGVVLSRRYEPLREFRAMSGEGTIIVSVKARSEEKAAQLIQMRLRDWAAAYSFGHEYQAKWDAANRAIVAV